MTKKAGNLTFPPAMRKRIDANRKPGDNRTDKEILTGSKNLLEEVVDGLGKDRKKKV